MTVKVVAWQKLKLATAEMAHRVARKNTSGKGRVLSVGPEPFQGLQLGTCVQCPGKVVIVHKQAA